MKRVFPWVFVLLALLPARAAEGPVSSVGMPQWIRDLVLEGGELEVLAPTDETPVVVRIAAVYPHGSAFRYDIEYYGLEPGDFDLLQFLRRKDGSELAGLDPIPVRIESTLPAGVVRPGELQAGEVPPVGAYRTQWLLGAAFWVGGLALLLGWGRRSKGAGAGGEPAERTLADHLKPLVERGIAGELSTRESARLEMALIAYWRRTLALEDRPSAEALEELKAHAEAGPLLKQLELWLHSPEQRGDVDVAELLRPYQGLAHDALQSSGAPATNGASVSPEGVR